jgi:hypothetical protein
VLRQIAEVLAVVDMSLRVAWVNGLGLGRLRGPLPIMLVQRTRDKDCLAVEEEVNATCESGSRSCLD